MTMPSVSIIILAAGESTRMGLPKQLLPMRGTTLLQHVIRTARESKAGDIRVVTGANADNIRGKVPEENFRYVLNPGWQEGMGSSIRAGIDSLPQNADAAIIALCDQPFLTTQVFNDLVDAFHPPDKSIVACEFGGQISPPTLFDRMHFSELTALQGDVGARKVVMSHQDHVAIVSFPPGSIDLDTPLDYRDFIKKELGM